jgi:hypothetical protein
MRKSKIASSRRIDNDTVYAIETTSATYVADGVYHHNCAMRCNKMRSGEYEKYRLALKDKYGEEVPEELENLARTTQYYKFTKDELLTIINDSKQALEWYATRNQANQEEKTR